MAYLQNEKARFQAEIQAAGAQIDRLTSQLPAQQQAIDAAQARVSAAQTVLAGVQAEVAPLEAAALDADRREADANDAIGAHLENEPEPTIETNGGPGRPNPAWITWNRTLVRLREQSTRAHADSVAAHGRLSEGAARVSQATIQVQAAQRQVAEATDALRVIQQAIAAARALQDAAQARVADVDRWNAEISRARIARPQLEQTAAELSDQAAAVEEVHALARVALEIAEETLSSLTARRDRLVPALDAVNAQLPPASQELSAAQQALTAVLRSIQQHRHGGPRR
jgi:chromosome segregation ATPase